VREGNDSSQTVLEKKEFQILEAKLDLDECANCQISNLKSQLSIQKSIDDRRSVCSVWLFLFFYPSKNSTMLSSAKKRKSIDSASTSAAWPDAAPTPAQISEWERRKLKCDATLLASYAVDGDGGDADLVVLRNVVDFAIVRTLRSSYRPAPAAAAASAPLPLPLPPPPQPATPAAASSLSRAKSVVAVVDTRPPVSAVPRTRDDWLRGMGCARTRPLPVSASGDYMRPAVGWDEYARVTDAKLLAPFFARLANVAPPRLSTVSRAPLLPPPTPLPPTSAATAPPPSQQPPPSKPAAAAPARTRPAAPLDPSVDPFSPNAVLPSVSSVSAPAAAAAAAAPLTSSQTVRKPDRIDLIQATLPRRATAPPEAESLLAEERQRQADARARAERASLEEARAAAEERASLEAMERSMQQQQQQQQQQHHPQQQQQQALPPQQQSPEGFAYQQPPRQFSSQPMSQQQAPPQQLSQQAPPQHYAQHRPPPQAQPGGYPPYQQQQPYGQQPPLQAPQRIARPSPAMGPVGGGPYSGPPQQRLPPGSELAASSDHLSRGPGPMPPRLPPGTELAASSDHLTQGLSQPMSQPMSQPQSFSQYTQQPPPPPSQYRDQPMQQRPAYQWSAGSTTQAELGDGSPPHQPVPPQQAPTRFHMQRRPYSDQTQYRPQHQMRGGGRYPGQRGPRGPLPLRRQENFPPPPQQHAPQRYWGGGQPQSQYHQGYDPQQQPPQQPQQGYAVQQQKPHHQPWQQQQHQQQQHQQQQYQQHQQQYQFSPSDDSDDYRAAQDGGRDGFVDNNEQRDDDGGGNEQFDDNYDNYDNYGGAEKNDDGGDENGGGDGGGGAGGEEVDVQEDEGGENLLDAILGNTDESFWLDGNE
jgi:hypothetical protein